MTTNTIGIVLCAAAVGAIVFLHGCERTPTSPNVVDQKHSAVPAKPPGYVTGRTGDELEPTPAPPVVLLKSAHDKKYYAPGKYQRVAPSGKVVGESDCTWVPPIAKAYPPAQVLAYMKAHGYSAKQINDLRLCLK